LVNNLWIINPKLTKIKSVNSGGIPKASAFPRYWLNLFAPLPSVRSRYKFFCSLIYKKFFNRHRPKCKSSKL